MGLPHGICLLWNPSLLTLNVVSDALIALSYISISCGLWFFAARRRDLPFRRLFWMFGTFIVACATTHLFEIWTIWHAAFWTDGWVKAFTAAVSLATAFMLVLLLPLALKIPSPNDIRLLNEKLMSTLDEKVRLLGMYEREQHVAQRFQEASLPTTLPVIPGYRFTSFYGSGSNEANIGGDWYDAMRLNDGRIIISIGDVCGSGLGAAMVMTNVRQVLRGVAQIHPDPVLMLDAADRTLRHDHPDTLVTAFVGIVDPAMMTLTYASAGHPAPLVMKPDGSIVELPYRGMMLGLRREDDRPAATMSLMPGQALVLFTDGLTEVTRDFEEGEQRLLAGLRSIDRTSASNFATAISQAVLNGEPRDDVAILTLEILDGDARNAGGSAAFERRRFHTSDAEAAAATRSSFTSGLHDRGFDADACYSAELVFGELIGNTVRYAYGMIDVVIDWTNRMPVLHICDEGPGFRHIPRLPSDVLSESGRGLFLVKVLTADFSVTKRPDGGSHARAVLAASAIDRMPQLQLPQTLTM